MDQIILGPVAGWLTAHLEYLVTTAVALAAALFALRQANVAKQQVTAAKEQVTVAKDQARAAKEQVIVGKDQARAAMEQVEVARSQLQVAVNSAEKAANQAEAYAGAQSAIAWRDQVFALHDRGLSPGQIRYIMHLEDGGGGYEGWNGRIDDIVRNLPSSPLSAAETAASVAHGLSCDQMPRERYGCTGPCQETARRSGCEAFRFADSGSPNESAGQVRHQD